MGSEFLGIARTLYDYRMVEVGDDEVFPAVIAGDSSILGEVYAVSDEILSLLDQLEDNGRIYERHLIYLFEDFANPVWIYLYLHDDYRKDSPYIFGDICQQWIMP